jgi:hypothetical protein
MVSASAIGERLERAPAEDTVAYPEQIASERVGMVDHYPCGPSPSQNPPNLADGPRRNRAVVEYAPRIDEVERRFPEGEVLGVRDLKTRRKP